MRAKLFYIFCIWLLTSGMILQGQTISFPMVEIPKTLTNPQSRADYLVLHYWDRFDFADTAQLKRVVFEQGLVDFLDILPLVKVEQAHAALIRLLKRAEVTLPMYNQVVDLLEKYLSESASPVRNEALFISVLEEVLSSQRYTDVEKIRYRYLLELAYKNQVGKPATDFSWKQLDGSVGRLYEITGDWILLFFYDPDCHTCQSTIEKLTASAHLQRLITEKRLTLIAFYPDEQEKLWKTFVSQLPTTWIHGYDPQLRVLEEEAYDLKSMPQLYLLDKRKTVLLKSATIEQLEEYVKFNLL